MEIRPSNIVVAVDGPSASGKSTVSRRAARELGFVYVDSGALYRGLTWKALRGGASPQDPAKVKTLMARVRCAFVLRDGEAVCAWDGEEPGLDLRSEAVRENVSDVAAQAAVRDYISERLRETAALGPIVMEGRDIGTVVFPRADFKFYLDADPEERARRRLRDIEQLEGRGELAAVRDSLARRDRKDSTRKAAPLQVAADATVIDSTAMSADEVVALIVRRVRGGRSG